MAKRPEETEDYSVEEIIAEIKGTADGSAPPASLASDRPVEDVIDAIAREVRETPMAERPQPSARPPEGEDERPEPVSFKLRRPAAAPVAEAPPSAAPPAPEPDIRVADSVPRRTLPEVIETPPADTRTVTFGRRLAPQPPTPAQEIFQEEARLEEEARRAAQAPWRTRKQPAQSKAAPPGREEADTQEFEVTLPPPDGETGTFTPETGETEAPRPAGPAYDFINLLYSDAQAAVRQLDRRTRAMSVRVLLLIPLLLIATYMTLCLPQGWPMPFGFTYTHRPYLYLLAFVLLHSTALVLSSEVTAAGLMRLLRLRPTLDSLVLFGQLCILVHNVSILIKPQWGGYLPFTSVGLLTCLIALLAKRQRAESLRRTYKASLMGTVPAAVKQVNEHDVRLAVKAEEGAWVEPEAIAQPDPTERMGEFAAPVLMAATVALALSASLGQGQGPLFIWCLAALAAAGAPLSLVLSASLPAQRLSRKLTTSGSGLINAKRTRRLAATEAVALRDGDVFPMGSVEIGGMKIAQNYRMEAVVGCAAALVQEIGGGLARAFSEFSRQQYVPPVRASNLRFFESGGISAQVDGHHVLLGSASFLMRMGVRVTEGVKLQTSLFIAIDGGFAGIFSIKYGVQSQAYAAFRLLRAGRIIPLLATRDMNITQAYVESRFELRAGGTEYPEMNERIRLSEPQMGQGADTLAFLSRDGMLPFAETVLAAKRQRRATRFGQVVGLTALLAGLLLMYFLAYNFKMAAAAPHHVLLYLILWLVPTWLGGAMITRM